MRPQVKVKNSKDRMMTPGCWVSECDFSSVVSVDITFQPLMLTGQLGTLYGFTIICDSIQQDEGARLLNLANEVTGGSNHD